MLKVMSITLKMDRSIEENKHYISPGGYTVETVSGEEVQFDFMDSAGYILDEDSRKVEFMLWNLDLDSFPESKNLNPEDIKKFTEIYIYTGEYDDPEIYPVEVCQIKLSCQEKPNGDINYVNLDKDSFKQVNEELALESHVRKTKVEIEEYLTDDFLQTTDFNEIQYELLRELMRNEDVLKVFKLTDLIDALTADNQELIGIYDVYYYNQYLVDDNGGTAFDKIPAASFNHNDFQMYKSKDGEYLVEIQM